MATISILEQCEIPPAPSNPAITEFSLPVTFLDMLWYKATFLVHSSFFYELPCSKSMFLENVVPTLKHSLSVTLSHFLPLAGNVIHPLDPTGNQKPILLYKLGDSLPLTICESKEDFKYLSGFHFKESERFHGLSPEMPSPVPSGGDTIVSPALAIKITLFPGHGICVSYVLRHAAGDASTFIDFVQAWGLINKTRFGSTTTDKLILPFYDRKTVVNNELDSLFWDLLLKNDSSALLSYPALRYPSNRIRGCFILKKEQIEMIKNSLAKSNRVSSFTIICALTWVCLAKSAAYGGEILADDEPDYFGFMADCRGRLKPPLPANYFGNCVAPILVELKHGELKRNNGFVKAAEAITEAITENVYGNRGITSDAKIWLGYQKLVTKREHWVGGSPKFDFYGIDYGWGKPTKYEPIFTDVDGSISLSKSLKYEGGFEFEIAKTKAEMEAFATIFTEVVTNLSRLIAKI